MIYAVESVLNLGLYFPWFVPCSNSISNKLVSAKFLSYVTPKVLHTKWNTAARGVGKCVKGRKFDRLSAADDKFPDHMSSEEMTLNRSSSGSIIFPLALRGDLRLRRGLPHRLRAMSFSRPNHQCRGIVRVLWRTLHLSGSCRLDRVGSIGVRVSVCCNCLCVAGGVDIGGLCALDCLLRCCRGCMCRSL